MKCLETRRKQLKKTKQRKEEKIAPKEAGALSDEEVKSQSFCTKNI